MVGISSRFRMDRHLDRRDWISSVVEKEEMIGSFEWRSFSNRNKI